MRPLVPWRSRAAVWATLPGLAGVVGYTAQFGSETTVVGYWPAATAAAAIYLIFSCAVAAVAGAWEGRRYRSLLIGVRTSGRPVAAVLVQLLWLPMAAGVLLQLFGVAIASAHSWGSPGGPSPVVLLAYVGIVFFHTCLGFVCGRWLPLVASLPVALLVSYCWLGFTWAVDSFPLRYLAGLTMSDCCSVETALDVRAPAIALFFSVPGGAALLVVAVSDRATGNVVRRHGLLVGSALMATTTVLSLLAGSGLGASPIVERPRSEAACSGTRPTICLFPEQVLRSDPERVIRSAARNVEAAGVSLPETIRTSNEPSTSTTLNIVVQVDMSEADLVHSITTALLPDTIASYWGSERDYDQRLEDAAVVDRWLIDVASVGIVDPRDVEPAVELQNPSTLAALERAPREEQVRWITQTSNRLTDCSTRSIPVPSA
jgi:hypothetical protein